MALSADDDVAQAVMKRWNSLPGLAALVPGGLERGRLTSFQPNVPPSGEEPPPRRKIPYATFEVTKGQEAIHATGGYYIDSRLVRIEIRGKESEVRDILGYLVDQDTGTAGNGVFNRQRLETQSPFLSALVFEEQDQKKDPNTKDGEDVWIGTYAFQVATDRNE